MQIILLPLDLLPTYIPFVVQCNKGDGTKSDPTAYNLIIYEEGGADATFDSTTITGSPFTPAAINSKTGLWGKLIAKSAFTSGKLYIAVWEMTINSITTAAVELYFACNSSDFKASVSTLESRLSSTRATYLDNLAYLTASPPTATAIRTEMDSNSTKLANLDASISSRAAASTALSSATWTSARAGYLDKLNVSGTLAHTDNAASFKATGFAVAGDAMTLTAAYDRAKNALAYTEYTAAPAASEVWANPSRTLTDKTGFVLATTPPTAVQIRQEIDANSTKLDAAVSTRLAASAYTAAPSVSAIRTEIDNNSTMLSLIEALAITIAEHTDNLPNDPASETTLTALQNAVNGISNVTRLTTAIPTYITLPSAGNTIVRINVALKDTSGNMEDPDSNIMAVTVSDAAGTSKNANLYQDYAVTTGLTAISGGTFDGYRQLVRSGVGLYYFFYKCASTDTEGERIFRFGWAEGGVALYEFRVSQVTLATSDVSAIANNVNTLLTRLTAPRGDKLDYLDATISSRLAASSYTAPPTVGAIADQVWDETYGTHLNSGSFGKFVSDINTRIDVTLSTRSSHSAADVWSSGTRTLTGTVSVGDKTGFSLTSAYDPAKTCAQSATALSNAVWTDTKAGYVDATISSRLAASGYTAPDNAGILSAIAGVSDQVSGISDITVNIDSTGLATQQTVEAIKAKTDNLPDDPVSEAALALMFANIAGDVWANTDRTLTGAVDVDADSFHAALNSWYPPIKPPIPPIILPPPNAEDCRVYLWIAGQSAQVIPPGLDKATAKIVRLPYTSNGRFFSGQEISGTYEPDTGLLYWDIVGGAQVVLYVPIFGVRTEITIPDGGTLDISTL